MGLVCIFVRADAGRSSNAWLVRRRLRHFTALVSWPTWSYRFTHAIIHLIWARSILSEVPRLSCCTLLAVGCHFSTLASAGMFDQWQHFVHSDFPL